jgi:hypothetical protein
MPGGAGQVLHVVERYAGAGTTGGRRDADRQGRLVDSIAGWDEVEAVTLDRLQGSEKLLLLDNIVLHRAAEAALMVRDRLIHLAPVSDDTRSISLDRSERLFADLLYVSPETGSAVVFEIKRARATARETIPRSCSAGWWAVSVRRAAPEMILGCRVWRRCRVRSCSRWFSCRPRQSRC